jgi:hypothetical protein
MQVAELLTLMGHLSVGNDNITPTERGIFLHYLNLAHLELYQETANFNQDLLVRETFDGVNATLPNMPYLVMEVYDATHKKALARLSAPDAIERGLGLARTGATPLGYWVQKNILSFVPVPTGGISGAVWYIPQPSPLREDMGEADIPYPIAFHPVLVDGALYYLFQEEGGFKSSQREMEAKARWQAGKTKLLSYLFLSGGQNFSTFNNA